MDSFFFIIRHQLRTRVVGVQFNLVDGGDGFAGGVAEEFFEVSDTEIGDADVADFSG